MSTNVVLGPGQFNFGIKDVTGVSGLNPILEVSGDLLFTKELVGNSAFLVADAWFNTNGGHAIIGKSEPCLVPICSNDQQDYKIQKSFRFQLLYPSAFQLAKMRDGKPITLHMKIEVMLITHAIKDWDPAGNIGVSQISNSKEIEAFNWHKDVLSKWGPSYAIPLLIPLPENPDGSQAKVTDILKKSWEKFQQDQYVESIREIRPAIDLLEKQLPALDNSKNSRELNVDERISKMLKDLSTFISSIKSITSAAHHPEDDNLDIVWTRDDALLVLSTTFAIAQRIFNQGR